MRLEEIEEKLKTLGPDSPERKLLATLLRRIEQRRLVRYKPYPWQLDFHNHGRTNNQRLLMAANGVGKTVVGAAETSFHLTGRYPDWWKGRRFNKNILAWVGSISNQTQRDYTQPALFGANLGEGLGTGFIPGECLVGKPRPRQAGIGDVVDIAHIRHVCGKDSLITMKCHPAGQRVAMADGSWKPIEDVQVGEWGLAANGSKRRFTQKHLYENRPTILIRTNSGDLICTPNHPVFTGRGKVLADEVAVGDSLEVAYTASTENDVREVWEVALTAFLIGDGMLRGKTPVFTCANDEVLASVRSILPPDLQVKHIAGYDYKLSSIIANSNRLTTSLRQSGLWGKKSYNKRIPSWAYRLPREQRVLFLRWLWSADGTVQRNAATYCSCQPGLANDVRLLLLSVGIQSKVRVHGDRHFQVYVSRDARVRFQEIGKIGADIEAGAPHPDHTWGEVIEVGEWLNQDVYGLGVDEDDHELVVEGFRVGNTYEQGWRMWQGAAPDVVWLDEQPDETAKEEKPIFSEVVTRIFRSSGIMYATLTPLLGETEMIRHFMTAPEGSAVWWRGATWDDAPHLRKEDKDAARAAYGEHEVDVRTQGVPMMGMGRVFTNVESDIKCSPKKIPDHWARLVAIDFGVDHPAAVAEIAWDRDEDVIYIVRTWRQRNADVPTHVAAIRGSEPWIPVAWPHDGLKREPGVDKGLKTLKQIYVEAGAKLLSMSARYKNDVGGGQPVEPIVLEMQNRFRDGAIKIFDTCHEFFDEYRSFHRDENGKIVPLRDDVIKAVMYGIMMRRYAKPKSLRTKREQSAYTSAVV